MSKLRTYNIGLEIEQTDKSNATFKALSENFKSLNQNLNSMSMENLNTQINTLSAEIRDSVRGTNDASKALDRYNTEIKKSVSSPTTKKVTTAKSSFEYIYICTLFYM